MESSIVVGLTYAIVVNDKIDGYILRRVGEDDVKLGTNLRKSLHRYFTSSQVESICRLVDLCPTI